MRYSVTGQFIEACDCTIICPCWVDEDPAQGSCTGLVAWRLDPGSTIDGVDVGDLRVVSVSTHGGNRRDASQTATVVYIDSAAGPEQLERLTAAFTGSATGPLGELAAVTGTVLGAKAAAVSVEHEDDGSWSVRVSPVDAPGSAVVRAEGHPKVFGDQPDPLVLRHTALSEELGIEPAANVTAHLGGEFHINVGELPGASIDTDGRSGMSGVFSYTFDDALTTGHVASS